MCQSDLLGMSKDELIQWAATNSRMTEEELRNEYSTIEVYCALYPIGIGAFIYRLAKMSRAGVRGGKAGKQLRKYFTALKKEKSGE